MKGHSTKEIQELFVKTMAELGSICTEDEEVENRFYFTYQGEDFYADIDNAWVRLVYCFWKKIDMYDIDVFPRLREAINFANRKCNVITFYSVDEEEEVVNVHSRSTFLFLPEIPDVKLFLYTQLGFFFKARRYVELDFDRRNRVFTDD